MTLAALFAPLLASATEPMNWQDVRVDDTVSFTQAIELAAANGEKITYPAGTRWKVEETLPLPGLPAVDIALAEEATCEQAARESEMALILPDGAGRNAEVGVQLARDCKLDVFIEIKDFGGRSFLQAVE